MDPRRRFYQGERAGHRGLRQYLSSNIEWQLNEFERRPEHRMMCGHCGHNQVIAQGYMNSHVKRVFGLSIGAEVRPWGDPREKKMRPQPQVDGIDVERATLFQ
jgi:hypothetical protein